jgi:glycogen operon protein
VDLALHLQIQGIHLGTIEQDRRHAIVNIYLDKVRHDTLSSPRPAPPAVPERSHCDRYGRGVHSWPAWDPLGVTPDGNGGARVALWAPGATRVDLSTFDDAGHEVRTELTERDHDVFHAHMPSMPAGTRYGFRVTGAWNPSNGQRWNPAKVLLDPYAKAIHGDYLWDSAIFGHEGTDDLVINSIDSAPAVPKSVVVDDHFDWGGDVRPHTPWTDTVIYETHVKGLTRLHPDVPDHQRGTYAGLAHPSVIAHLTTLGVTAVELLPVHQSLPETFLLEQGRTNYWGYNSIGFFAPHAGYSSTGGTGGQVSEFKGMVRALHAAGLEVILDVVYNHTAEGSHLGPTLCFRGIDNAHYYRLTDGGRRYADSTGCGNSPSASHPHVAQLILDSLRYWVTEMHVDGFRFDLAPTLARSPEDVNLAGAFMTALQQDPVLRRVKLIAEPWDLGYGGYQVGNYPSPWSEWNDRYRGCIRDFWRGSTGIGELGTRLSGSADLFHHNDRGPLASINFVTAHDGFTLADLVSYNDKHNEANGENNADGTQDNRSCNYGAEGPSDDPAILAVRQRQIRNFISTLLLSTGVPMLLGGDEFGRTQGGNNNAYCQDNEISWFDWSWQQWQSDLKVFASNVIALRRHHSAFTQRYFFDGVPLHTGGPKDLAWLSTDGVDLTVEQWQDPQCHSMQMFLAGESYGAEHAAEGPSDTAFLILIHAGTTPIVFTLPTRPYGRYYRRVIDTYTGQSVLTQDRIAASEKLTLQPRSMVVLRAYDGHEHQP